MLGNIYRNKQKQILRVTLIKKMCLIQQYLCSFPTLMFKVKKTFLAKLRFFMGVIRQSCTIVIMPPIAAQRIRIIQRCLWRFSRGERRLFRAARPWRRRLKRNSGGCRRGKAGNGTCFANFCVAETCFGGVVIVGAWPWSGARHLQGTCTGTRTPEITLYP